MELSPSDPGRKDEQQGSIIDLRQLFGKKIPNH